MHKVTPEDTAEYKCGATIEAKTYPPTSSEFLLQCFNGRCNAQKLGLSRWVVGQLPKRKWGEIWGRPNQAVEGWGICYKEGWDRDMIVLLSFVLLSASLLFGVLWTTLRDDIQGAFGVASWMVATGGAMMAVIATQVESM